MKFKKGQKLNLNDDIMIPLGTLINKLVKIDKSQNKFYGGDEDFNDFVIIKKDFEITIK